MTAIRCLCASVVAFLLNGRSSSVPKPGIHIFQFLSRTIWIWKLKKWKISMIIPEHPVHQYCSPSCAWQGHRLDSRCAQWNHQQSEKQGAKSFKKQGHSMISDFSYATCRRTSSTSSSNCSAGSTSLTSSHSLFLSKTYHMIRDFAFQF